MKQAPPTSAPAVPRKRHAHQIDIWVDAGPGSMLVAAIARSNSSSRIHPRRSTQSPRSSEMWAGGPPKPMHPIRPHSMATSRSEGTGETVEAACEATAAQPTGARGRPAFRSLSVARVAASLRCPAEAR